MGFTRIYESSRELDPGWHSGKVLGYLRGIAYSQVPGRPVLAPGPAALNRTVLQGFLKMCVKIGYQVHL